MMIKGMTVVNSWTETIVPNVPPSISLKPRDDCCHRPHLARFRQPTVALLDAQTDGPLVRSAAHLLETPSPASCRDGKPHLAVLG